MITSNYLDLTKIKCDILIISSTYRRPSWAYVILKCTMTVFPEMEQNELGPTDLREDLFDHFCEKLDNFCRQYSEEEKQLLAATTPTKQDEDVPDFVKKVFITKHTKVFKLTTFLQSNKRRVRFHCKLNIYVIRWLLTDE